MAFQTSSFNKKSFSGGSGTFDLYVNDNFISTVPYSIDEQIVTITDINIEGRESLNKQFRLVKSCYFR